MWVVGASGGGGRCCSSGATYVRSVVAHFLQVDVVDGVVVAFLLEELQRVLLQQHARACANQLD